MKTSAKKSGPSGKPNKSILNFFKKVDSPLKDDSIFVSQTSHADVPMRLKGAEDESRYVIGDIDSDGDDLRFNEVNGSFKKRKTSTTGLGVAEAATELPTISTAQNEPTKLSAKAKKPAGKKSRRSGPFVSDSESENEGSWSAASSMAALAMKSNEIQDDREHVSDRNPTGPRRIKEPSIQTQSGGAAPRKRVDVEDAQAKWEALQPNKSKADIEKSQESSESEYEAKKKYVPKTTTSKKRITSAESTTRVEAGNNSKKSTPHVPSLETEVTRTGPSTSEIGGKNGYVPKSSALRNDGTVTDDWGKFEDLDDFPDDFAEGEEFEERKWMEQQAQLEAAEQAISDRTFNDFDDGSREDRLTPACPICDTSLEGVSPENATRHVNGCLDGNPIPLPSLKQETEKSKELKTQKTSKEVKLMPPNGSKQFIRKSAIPRPGQANPIELGEKRSSGPTTAFSQLMSGKAEDVAWANAAAAENSSRGKPAYQRTCPFYKIMPGLFICVDAFRYGAVQGCNAYFLSHFHSDHYIGLTSTWCHGPIYCSKVTANLVKQQLRVDPKWVVPLEFEVQSEVPGTRGVQITMIPANHCPGSSLFLFEKVVGRGPNPKTQRILHCGDFRACPAHVVHPRLMPDLVDSVTGKTKQQKIDVCYLDTTYLNPKYSFPSQEEVIKACADMCVSLTKDRADESDAWEVVKKQRAGAGMNNFISAGIKPEDESIAMEIGSTKARGRLLVICGTYSIGKERICMGIARALDCKIWAPPGKMRICAALEDPELMSRMTDDPKEAQIHMQMLMEIRAETLQEYLNSYKPHFSRVVGFRPSGWNYRPPVSRYV